MPPSPQTAKLTSTLHLLIPRLRLLQKKSTASSVHQRRELAQLLETQRDASARIRVENVIATDIAVEVMEMVELYCELLLARAGVLDGLAFGEAGARARGRVRDEAVLQNQNQSHGQGQGQGQGGVGSTAAAAPKGGGGGGIFRIFGAGSKPTQTPTPPTQAAQDSQTQGQSETAKEHSSGEEGGIGGREDYYLDAALDEAATAIFYAWSRFPSEVRELTLLRTLLADRYGKDFMALASENKLAGVKVPGRLVKGLRVRPPSTELVESYLKEIARAYKVPWGEADSDLEDGGGGGGGGGLENQETVGEGFRRASESAELTRATPPKGFNAHSSPVSVAPPGPRSDNPNPRVKVPDDENKDRTEISSPSPSPSAQRPRDKSGIPDVDELSRRFAALKR